MLDKIKRLSYSSIKLLNENPTKWFSQYIKWIYDNEFHDYFVVGNAFHLIVENFNKTWDRNIKVWQSYIYREAERLNHKEELYKEFAQLDALYNNYFDWTEIKPKESELEVSMEFDWVKFIGKLDAVHDWFIEDYKWVSSFLNEDNEQGMNKLAEYHIQGWIYMILYKQKYWEYPKFARFTETKKSIPNLMRCRKPTIIEMCKATGKWENDDKMTIEKLIEKYRLVANGKNVIDIMFSQELVDRCEQLILRAIEIIKNMKEELLSCPFGSDDVIKSLINNKE